MDIFDIVSIIILTAITVIGGIFILGAYNKHKEENDIGVYKIMKKDKEGVNEISIMQEIQTLFDLFDSHCKNIKNIEIRLKEHETLLLDYHKINDMNRRIAELEKIIKQGE